MDMLRRSIIAAAAILSISAGQAFAGPYSAIYSFGDSLSDVGNGFIATGGAKPASPYVNGQFSNGPVWVQDLATELGLSPLKPSCMEAQITRGGARRQASPSRTTLTSRISHNRSRRSAPVRPQTLSTRSRSEPTTCSGF
jgi:phospholipase/lecithinase/hemolysin